MIFSDDPIVYTFGTLALVFTEDGVLLGVALLVTNAAPPILTSRGRLVAGLPLVEPDDERKTAARRRSLNRRTYARHNSRHRCSKRREARP